MKNSYICVKLLSVFILVCLLLSACSQSKDRVEVHTDTEFVEQQFPKIKEIEAVKYFYNVKNSEREIGLQNIEFCGFIKLGKSFLQKIETEYKWKETKKSKKKLPKPVLMEGENKEYHFTYNHEFSHDGKYISNSWHGYFYLDKEQRVLYFECEW